MAVLAAILDARSAKYTLLWKIDRGFRTAKTCLCWQASVAGSEQPKQILWQPGRIGALFFSPLTSRPNRSLVEPQFGSHVLPQIVWWDLPDEEICSCVGHRLDACFDPSLGPGAWRRCCLGRRVGRGRVRPRGRGRGRRGWIYRWTLHCSFLGISKVRFEESFPERNFCKPC